MSQVRFWPFADVMKLALNVGFLDETGH